MFEFYPNAEIKANGFHFQPQKCLNDSSALLIENRSFICRNFIVEPPVGQILNKRLKRQRKFIMFDSLSRKNCDSLVHGEVNVGDLSNKRIIPVKTKPE